MWLLLEYVLNLVYLMHLFLSPLLISAIQSLVFCTIYSDIPSTNIPVKLSSLIYKAFYLSSSENKSNNFSLYI